MIESTLCNKLLCVTELRLESISVATMKMGLDFVEIDCGNSSEDISKIRFPATVEFCSDEDFTGSFSGSRRPCPARNRRLGTVGTQVVERPLRFGLSTAESIHENVHADRMGKPCSALEEFDFPVVDRLLQWDLEVRFLE